MNYSERFYTTFLPILWVAVAVGWGIGLNRLSETRTTYPLRNRIVFAVFAVLVAYQIAFNMAKLGDERRFAVDQATIQFHQHTAIGKMLGDTMPKDEWLISYIDAGAIPYFSKLRTIDFGALNDVALSREHLSEKEKVDYFFSKNPGVAVFTSAAVDGLKSDDLAAAIIADPRFSKYILYKKYLSQLVPADNYHEFLYLRKDLAALYASGLK